MKSDIVNFNIVILPDTKIRRQTIALSKKVSKDVPSHFILDGINYHPHITLYQAAYPKKNLVKIKTALTDIASNLKPFTIKLMGFTSLLEFIFYEAEKSSQLMSTHLIVLKKLNLLREGNIPKEYIPQLGNPLISEKLKYNLKEYGYLLAKEAFTPHITITALKQLTDVQKGLALLKNQQQTFTVNDLFLTTIGPWGTCTSIIERFPLSTSN